MCPERLVLPPAAASPAPANRRRLLPRCCRVQQALAGGGSDGSAGGAGNNAVAELAGLMSLISLQAPQHGQPHNAAQHAHQQQAGASSGAADMDTEGSAGPEPPSSSAARGGDSPSRLGRLVAAAEGATYVCQQCGGLVSVERGQAHQQLWCPALHPS